ncbi:sensor histidine kinase [Niabella beijingensis]|uniref:sensor histidine kinase n=1 Tax=Niabella beijingensis TaxID=2872700 RepID=UPI001CC1471B|nr:histidine kinase [Niabella beijingensis]MBZ4189469.1 histidine kinase [Niabella beijingensis]
MKGYFFILLLTLLKTAAAQDTDRRHPYFRDTFNWQQARTEFRNAWSRDAGARKDGRRDLRIIGYYSTTILLQGLFAQTRVPQLKANRLDSTDHYETFMGYSGAYPIPVFDSVGVIVTISGINKGNAHQFEYRILKDKTTELVPWSQCTTFCAADLVWMVPDEPHVKEVAYLGQFKESMGTFLLFQVRKKNDTKVLVTLGAYWLKRAPEVVGVFTQQNMNAFLTAFKIQWQMDPGTNVEDGAEEKRDRLLIRKDTFQNNENSLIFYLADKVRSKEIVEYNLIKGTDSTGWKANDFDLNFIWLKELAPGQYHLLTRYSVQRQSVSRYPFIILPAWYQTLWFKILTGIAAMLLLAFLMILYINRLQHKKLRTAALQKQQISTELKSIRSQFNPHFVFNALNSIQGLITKNDPAGAHQYLSEFSALMRESLKGSDREMISIARETAILRKYLNLEQLRFGFAYEINTDDAIDLNAVEVPALLLQPLAENAVKHGIAVLHERGLLKIEFRKEEEDLIVTVTDNGKGFDPTEAAQGFGLKLTKDRIALLNETLHRQRIGLAFDKNGKETSAIIYFKNWLL